MQDVTDLILNYREAVRHLWGAYLQPFNDEEMPWLLIPMQYYLFYSMVVWPLGRASDQQAVSGNFRYGQGIEMPAVDVENNRPGLPYLRIIPNLNASTPEIPVIWYHNDRDRSKSVYEYGILTTATIDIRFLDLHSERNDFRECHGNVYS